jgi:hypothetical protein
MRQRIAERTTVRCREQQGPQSATALGDPRAVDGHDSQLEQPFVVDN